MNKKTIAAVLCALLLTGCSSAPAAAKAPAEETVPAAEATEKSLPVSLSAENGEAVNLLDTSDMFTDRDLRGDYGNDAVEIQLSGSSTKCSSPAVSIEDTTVTIKDEGVYMLSGTLAGGMVIVDAENTDKVQLVLNNVDIVSESSAAIYVKQAKKVFITLAEGSDNKLTNGGSFTDIDENSIDAVIYSKDDITLNGSGALRIKSPAGVGISSRDDLVIAGGSITVSAGSHGLFGKNSVRIAGGSLEIDAVKDGIQAEHKKDESKGYIYIADGSIKINADGDGLSASGAVQADGGQLDIVTGGGSAAVTKNESGDWKWNRPQPGAESAKADDTASAKGIKAKLGIAVNNGTLVIDSADDSMHSSADLFVTGGSLAVSTGDDGLHADKVCAVSGGALDIRKSYEGIEGETVSISGGAISIISDDDGLNAAGGADMSGFEGFKGFGGNRNFGGGSDCIIEISGGTVFINADGDGIDSNGALTVSGGEIYVCGPISSGNSAIDFEASGEISGGRIVAAGAEGMAQNFSNAVNQGSVLVSTGAQKAGTVIELKDESGSILLTWECGKDFGSVVISCPEIQQGKTYTLTAGGFSTEIKMDSLLYSAGGFGGMQGHGGKQGGFGGKGERPDGMGERPEGMGTPPEMPEGMGERPEMPDDMGERPEMPDGAFPGHEPGGMKQ